MEPCFLFGILFDQCSPQLSTVPKKINANPNDGSSAAQHTLLHCKELSCFATNMITHVHHTLAGKEYVALMCVFAPLDCKTHTSMNEDYGKNCLPNTNESSCAASCSQVCKCRKGSLAPLHQQVHTHAKLQTTLAMTWKYTYEQQYI